MQTQYYITIDGKLDGPHDLVTIMRRVRAGKITPNTQIFSDGAAAPLPASFIPEIAGFFDQKILPAANKDNKAGESSFATLLSAGWRFTMEKNIMTVYAGALLLVCIMMVVGLVSMLGSLVGGLASWFIFIMLHHIYLIYVLRLYRGQTTGAEFVKHYIAPALPSLIISCMLFAFLTSIGCLIAASLQFLFSSMQNEILLQTLMVTIAIIPGTLIGALFILVPFITLDQRCSPLTAFRKSQAMLTKPGQTHFGNAASLTLLHVLCLIVIIPLPLTLPIFAAALSELYEGITTS